MTWNNFKLLYLKRWVNRVEYMLEMLEKIQLMRNPFFDRLFIGITVLGEELWKF